MLLITDVSVSESVAEKIEEKIKEGYQIKLIDHHKTATWLDERYEWATVIPEKNGKKTAATSLLYEYLIDQKWLEPTYILSDYVELVRLYDTWDWKEANNHMAKQVNDLLYMIGGDTFMERIINQLTSPQENPYASFSFNEQDKYLLAIEEDRIQRYIDKKKKQLVLLKNEFVLSGTRHVYEFGVVFAENYISEVGNDLCESYPDIDFVVLIDPSVGKISFRTIKDSVDVSAIAKKYGGGGHMKASGCSFTKETINTFVTPIISKKA